MAFAGSSGRGGARPGTRQRGDAARDTEGRGGEAWRGARRPVAARARDEGSGDATAAAARGRSFSRGFARDVDWPRVGAAGAGLAIGALLGAGVALLLAPHSGTDTRRMLRRVGKRGAVRASDAWEDLGEELRHATYRGRTRVRRGVRGGRWRASELLGGEGPRDLGRGGRRSRKHRASHDEVELEIDGD